MMPETGDYYCTVLMRSVSELSVIVSDYLRNVRRDKTMSSLETPVAMCLLGKNIVVMVIDRHKIEQRSILISY